MRKRILIVAVSVVLGLGAFAAAQVVPRLQAEAATIVQDASGQITLAGRVRFDVNGVQVSADRAVVNGREVALEGNVRLTLPQPK